MEAFTQRTAGVTIGSGIVGCEVTLSVATIGRIRYGHCPAGQGMHRSNEKEPTANFGLPVRLPCFFDDDKKIKRREALYFLLRWQLLHTIRGIKRRSPDSLMRLKLEVALK